MALIVGAVSVAATWLAALGCAAAARNRLVFGRTRRVRAIAPGPDGQDVHVVECRVLVERDVELQGWVATCGNEAPAKVVWYFGGRNEDVAWVQDLAGYFGKGWAVVACNYRGFGASGGRPSEAVCREDALRFGQEVFGQLGVPPGRVMIVARSLGTAIAAPIAAEMRVGRLALITPLRSLRHLLLRRTLLAPAAWLTQGAFDAHRVAPRIQCPCLVVLAAGDRVIPHSDSMAVAKSLKGAVQIATVEGAGHNAVARDPRTVRLLVAFGQA